MRLAVDAAPLLAFPDRDVQRGRFRWRFLFYPFEMSSPLTSPDRRAKKFLHGERFAHPFGRRNAPSLSLASTGRSDAGMAS
jgi:hypothetical protein